MRLRSHAVIPRVMALVTGALVALAGSADTDEAWLHRAQLPDTVKPLLGIILDRSTATSRTLSVDEPYDPLLDYGGSLPAGLRCNAAKAYFRRGPGPAPDCGLQAGLELAPGSVGLGLQCELARAPLATQGFFIASRAAQRHGAGGAGAWGAPQPASANAVECRADRDLEIAWDRPPLGDSYIFYAGNFLNYLRGTHAPTDRSIAELISSGLAQALAATGDLEVALIRVDDNGPDGGYVARAPVASELLAAEVQSISGEVPSGGAALAETLVEAAQWLQGSPKRFGQDERADPAAANPLAPDQYLSPFSHACRPVTLAYLTAGEPSGDELAGTAAGGLHRFDELTGGCGTSCLDAIGSWLASADLREDLPGSQTAPVTWITPPPVPPSISGDTSSLADPLAYVNVVARAFQHDAAIAGLPQLSAAGLTPPDSGTAEPSVIFGLTVPVARERWLGNLLRYALRAPAGPLEPPLLVDRDGQAAIDRLSGLPLPGTRSLWSDAPDSNLLTGGAAGRLPDADARRVHTDIATGRLLDAANRLEPGNAQFDRSAVGLGPTDPETLDDVLAWMAAQRTIGDPGPHSPIVVEYPESGRVVAYVVTHDGFLQAFDAESGVELWAWMPKELLPRLPVLLRNEPTTFRSHGIDGPLVLHSHDANRDGHVTAAHGEHLWLLFGLGSGGDRYYALDIATPTDPRLLWSIALPEAGVESSAEPVVTRLAIAGSGQSEGDWVVLLGGGHDPRVDSGLLPAAASGNSLHIADAQTGEILWSGGGNGPELAIAGLASLPSAPRALDIDGDGYLDRSYVLDVGGGLWRIEFATGRSSAELATAVRIARLGTGAHRFHASPDVSIARIGNENRIAIAAGSGRISNPRDTTNVDRLYVVFDQEAAATPREVSESDLHDATDARDALPPDAPGWFVRLDSHGTGEKVIGSTVTFDHVLRFQTYQPLSADEAAPCGPPLSVSRRYALDVRTALPLTTAVESEEEAEEIPASGLPVGTRFGFPGRWQDSCEGCRPRPFGIIGGETFDPGYAGDPVRTSWRKLTPPPVSP